MNNSIASISLTSLTLSLTPALLVLLIFARWSLPITNSMYALTRMLSQLLLVGYALAFIFESQGSWLILLILCIMCIASSWIALGSIKEHRTTLYTRAFFAIFLASGLTLALITQGVLSLNPWYAPHYMIPIAGMIFSGSMNSVSLAAERFHSELQNKTYIPARNIAFQASMIPVINSLLAVGLVSLPGMMTGQILSGISPFIAARYQIMVMAMIFGASGLIKLSIWALLSLITQGWIMSFKNASSFSRIPTAIQFRIAKHQQILRIILLASPAQLRPHIKDCVVNEESLMIYVSSAVWASQLRFCGTQIQSAVNTQSKENIKKVRVRVLAPTSFKAEKKSRKIIPSEDNIESLRNNADTLSEGRLKNALLSLSNTLLKQNK